MPSKNRYYRHLKISEAKFRHLLHLFAMDLTATDVAQLCGLSVRSVNAVYQRICLRLTQECAAQSSFSGELEADESYFDPRRVRSKRGRGAGGKIIIFSLLKRGQLLSIPKSSPMPPKPRCKPLFGVKRILTASFAPTAGGTMMGWLTSA